MKTLRLKKCLGKVKKIKSVKYNVIQLVPLPCWMKTTLRIAGLKQLLAD